MDYKYIEQLLDCYWKAETSLEEEEILKAFFSQKNIPSHLQPYQSLFVYAQQETTNNVLDEAFAQKILNIIGEETPVKACTINMTQRFKPLFKAAAIVAFILTISNAMQMSFNQNDAQLSGIETTEGTQQGTSVAITDSTTLDSMSQSKILSTDDLHVPIIK